MNWRLAVLLCALAASCDEVKVPVFTHTRDVSPTLSFHGNAALRQYNPVIGVADAGPFFAWLERDEQTWELRQGNWVDGGTSIEGRTLDLMGARVMNDLGLTKANGRWLLTSGHDHGGVLWWSLNAAGEVREAGPLSSLPGTQGHFAAVAVDDGLFAAWTESLSNDYDVWAGWLGPTNQVLDAGTFTPGTVYEYNPTVARVGTSLFVGWESFSARINFDFDIAGRWVGSDAGVLYSLVSPQRNPRAVGGDEVVLLVWWDTGLRQYTAIRLRPDGTSPDLAPVALGDGMPGEAALTRTADGFLVAYNGVHDDAGWLRVVPVSEREAFTSGDGVWVVDAALEGANDRPAITAGVVAFTQLQPDGGTRILARAIGPLKEGDVCRLGTDCLSGLCDLGHCAQ